MYNSGSSRRRGGPSAGAGAGAGVSPDAAGGYQAVDPMYLKLCDDVQRMLRQYGSTIAGIKKLSDLIGTRRDSNATRRQLRKETASGKQQAKTLAGLLKQDFPPFLNDPATPRRERQTRKHTHQKFFKDFKDRAAAFQQVVETAATREKEYAQAARRASSVDHDSSDEEAPLAGRQSMQQVEFNEALIEEREEHIQEIHAAVVEVNDIFQDLAALVDEQAKDVDTLELNITEGHTRVGKGVEHLDKAESYQRKSSSKMICLLVIVLCVAVGLVLGIVFGTKKKKH